MKATFDRLYGTGLKRAQADVAGEMGKSAIRMADDADIERAIHDAGFDSIEEALDAAVRDTDRRLGKLPAEVLGDLRARGASAQVLRVHIPNTVTKPYAQKAFNLSGKIDRDVREGGKALIQELLAKGADTGEMIKQLDGYFSQWFGKDEAPAGNVIPLRAKPRLENTVRTEFSKAYNTGREAVMFDPSVTVLGGVMLSAIMDSRVSDYCERWDGAIFDPVRDRDLLARQSPPRHFQCRTTTVPITKYEDVKPWARARLEALAREVPPQEGFGGLAKAA